MGIILIGFAICIVTGIVWNYYDCSYRLSRIFFPCVIVNLDLENNCINIRGEIYNDKYFSETSISCSIAEDFSAIYIDIYNNAGAPHHTRFEIPLSADIKVEAHAEFYLTRFVNLLLLYPQPISWWQAKRLCVIWNICHPSENIRKMINLMLPTICSCKAYWRKLSADQIKKTFMVTGGYADCCIIRNN